MVEHQKESIAKKLKTGEPWIALIYPTGITQEDLSEAEAYAKENGIYYFTHGNIAIAYYADESRKEEFMEKVAYAVRLNWKTLILVACW